MFDIGLFNPEKKTRIEELNVVPILDMLVAVIFFLLLSTSFVGYTKLHLPPASVSTSTDPVKPPPLDPKLYLTQTQGQLELILSWNGAQPGQRKATITAADLSAGTKVLMEKTRNLVSELAKKYPTEKTLQVGLKGSLPYQSLIDVMDATRESMPDIVLISYEEVDYLSSKVGG